MEVFSGVDDSVVESLWYRISGETRNCGIVLGLCCRPPDQGEEVGKAFKQMTKFLNLRPWFSWGTLTCLVSAGRATWGDVSGPRDLWRISGKIA